MKNRSTIGQMEIGQSFRTSAKDVYTVAHKTADTVHCYKKGSSFHMRIFWRARDWNTSCQYICG